ncbi:methyl-accepting chemotaxis protein [Chitinimonas koreensis]|uniref:methyl-accepting chemotaxis protein n=1 Tax=Chitinimonas koreensis TaxID=356302 RepID=UPI000425785C|nr:methyl-accepting chemotaxis protein [Chitinimonas koreensis]QNM97541.1 methyl-accepting chemotaxis protein [Chitinimonas koreensis]
MWLLNLPTRVKLTLSFALILLGAGGLLYLAQASLQGVRANNQAIAQLNRDLAGFKSVRFHVHDARAEVLNALLTHDAGRAAELAEQFKVIVAEDAAALQDLRAHTRDDAVLGRLTDEVATVWQDFVAARDQRIVPLIGAGQFDEARQLATGAQRERVGRLRDLATQLDRLVAQRVRSLDLDNERLIARQLDRVIWLGSGLIALVAALTLLLSRSIAHPLQVLTGYAQRISVGDVPERMEFAGRGDEVGRLSQAFAALGDYIRSLAGQAERLAGGDLGVAWTPRSEQDVLGRSFATMVQRLSELTLEMREGIVVIASASEEILATAGQVAGGAQESATSITEIATTVEEVKQTALLASRRAVESSQAAERNRLVAQAGRQSVAETLGSMTLVRDQMHAMAEGILRLGEQSQAISEIVASVNELAEQSNLLGVNASIEAGKAGDAGKGFAVVALEVKALAEQSKQATAQVRAILGDVQRAMTRAALAAEQGSKAVDQGFERTRLSDEAMRKLAESIEESGDMAQQIASVSQQQVAGMDQVVAAVLTLRQASQDNAAGARQVDQSARDLHRLGSRLKLLAGQFRLPGRQEG